MVDENAAALSALASQGGFELASVAPAIRRIPRCPHCHHGFGSASLEIHVRRCRALLPDPNAEAAAAEAAAAAAKNLKKHHVPKLVDLCLRMITRNFQAVCLDKVKTAPEHEAALVESLPTDLVHRIITNLVFENRNIAKKEDKQRGKIRELQKELEQAKSSNLQLLTQRHQIDVYRSRLSTQEQLIESLQRDAELKDRDLVSLQQQNAQLQSQLTGYQKTQSRLERKIQQLARDNDKLKSEVSEVRKTEATLFKKLASAAKSGKPSAVKSGKPFGFQRTAQSTRTSPKQRPSIKRPSTSSEIRTVHPRPRMEGSKIPFPRGLLPQYVTKCAPVTDAGEL